MLNIGRLSKMAQTITISNFFHFNFILISIKKKSGEKNCPYLILTFACFNKVGLAYSRVGAGAGNAS
jgi:hypothetical protein